MKKLSIIIAVISMAFYGNAQIDIPNNSYRQLSVIENPASVLLEDGICAGISYQDSWTGFKGAPELYNVNVYGSITPEMGFGASMNRTTAGIFTKNEFSGAYAYKLKLDDETSLGMGLSFGVLKYKTEPVYSSLDVEEPLIGSDYFDETQYRQGFGLSLIRKGLRLEFSVPELYNKKQEKFFNSWIGYAAFDYNFDMNVEITLRPSILISNLYNLETDYNFALTGIYNKMIYAEIGYGNLSKFSAAIGFDLSMVQLGYKYTMNHSVLSEVSGGSNQIYMIYRIGKGFME